MAHSLSLPSPVLTALTALAVALPLHARAQERSEPLGITANVQGLESIPRLQMPPIDLPTLLAEDAQRGPAEAPRYAFPHDVALSPEQAGLWEEVDGKTLLWRLRLASPGAKSLNLGFTKYHMPAGGHLFLYPLDYAPGKDPKGNRLRHFTDEDNEPHGELWTPMVAADEIVVEVTVPKAARPELQLALTKVNHDYLGFGTREMLLASGSCNVDVVCSEGNAYRDQIRAVGVISTGGSRFCSGSLLNNTGPKKPLFMTANHCGVRASNAASLVVFWNFQNSVCRPVGSPQSGQEGDGRLNQFNTGSFFRATFSSSDFTLVELDDAPSTAFGVFLAGWDRRNGPFPDGAVGIHHPSTDEKRISLSNTSTIDNGTHHRVFWRPGIGVTEPGSSGSALYTKQGLFIGQLTGGASACGNANADMWDRYGKLSRSWEGGGTAATRARDYLDPLGTAPMTFQGRNWNDGGQPVVVFADDFEASQGWTPNPNGTDTATTGAWERGDPQATTSSGPKQLGTAVSGFNDLVTGRLAGASAGTHDIDGGTTSIQSPSIGLPSTGELTLSFSFYLAHLTNASSADFFRVRVVVGTTSTTVFQRLGAATDVDGAWQTASASLNAFRGQSVRILIEAADAATGSLVEAAVDDVRIFRQ